MIREHGPSILFLPSPRLDRKNIQKATSMLGQLASNFGISNREVREQAQRIVHDELADRGELNRFRERL